MAIDSARLRSLSGYDDPRGGFSEDFLEERLGPDGAFALRCSPLGAPSGHAWVICPSIGQEHGNLRRLEALIARRLAEAGVTTLRIRPDVTAGSGAMGELDLSTRVAEAEAAVALLRAAGGDAEGAIGVLSGAMVAALACERDRLGAMALVEPAVRGKQYVRESLRRQAVAELMAATEAEEEDTGTSPLHELETTGSTTVRGLRLGRSEYDRIAAVDLTKDIRSFRGRSLLVAASPTGAAPPGVVRLKGHLEELGGDVALEGVEDPLVAPFGEYYYENVGLLRLDTRLQLDRRLAELIARWIAEPSAGDRA